MKKNNKNKLRKFIITLIPVAAFLFFGWFLIVGVNIYIKNASYFNVKRVILNGLDDEKVARDISKNFLYRNIFSVDLKKIREDLKIANPQFYDVEVIKYFPDQLTINVIIRRPLAQIKQKGFFLVDSEGVIVSSSSNKPFGDFIIISGIKGISSLSFGKKINLEQLMLGLRLTRELENIKEELISFAPEAIKNRIEIDVSKQPSFYVYLGKLELRFYDEKIDIGLKSLMKILPTINKNIKKVKYIDLRFEEPAVSFEK